MADRGFSDLLSTASSLLNSQSHSNPSHSQKPSSSSASDHGAQKPSSHAQKPSYGEIYESAQVVMSAAKAKLHKTGDSASEDMDMGKLAGAAGTLIGAVSHYSKLEETAYGKYAHKAQDYLHSYEGKHGKPGAAPSPSSQPSANYSSSEQGHDRPASNYTASEQGHSRPSAPPQGYPSGYPPQGYPDAQQGHGYGSQGHSKPAESQGYVQGYPPKGYPASDETHSRPSRYS